jgi:hypothetical protein
MLSEQEIMVQMETLSERYGERHQMFEGLRRFWHGHIWQDSDQMAKSLASVFRDLRHGAGGDREPDIKVTLPLIEAVVEKFMGYLTSVPQISVLTPPIGYAGLRKEETCRALADQNERFFYGVWERTTCASTSLTVLVSAADGLLLHRRASRLQGQDGQVPESLARELVPDLGRGGAVPRGHRLPVGGPDGHGDPALRRGGRGAGTERRPGWLPWRRRTRRDTLQITEWYDEDSKTTLVAGHKVQSVEHKLGFCPWVHVPFYSVPDEPFGKRCHRGQHRPVPQAEHARLARATGRDRERVRPPRDRQPRGRPGGH